MESYVLSKTKEADSQMPKRGAFMASDCELADTEKANLQMSERRSLGNDF